MSDLARPIRKSSLDLLYNGWSRTRISQVDPVGVAVRMVLKHLQRLVGPRS